MNFDDFFIEKLYTYFHFRLYTLQNEYPAKCIYPSKYMHIYLPFKGYIPFAGYIPAKAAQAEAIPGRS